MFRLALWDVVKREDSGKEAHTLGLELFQLLQVVATVDDAGVEEGGGFT